MPFLNTCGADHNILLLGKHETQILVLHQSID